MFIPILVGSALYFTWKAATGVAKTDTSLTLTGASGASSIKLGQTIGVFPPAGACILNVSPPVPATKPSVLAAAIAPAIAAVVAPAAVAPTAKAAAANVTSDMPTVLATVTQQVTPAIAAVVPAASVAAAATAAAANIVSAAPTTQSTLAAAIAPTLVDTVHPDNVPATANAAAANITLNLGQTGSVMAAAMAPAIAAVVPSETVPGAAAAAAATTMNGEAGSFMLNPRHMQSMMHGEPGYNGGTKDRWRIQHNIYEPGRIQHSYGSARRASYPSNFGEDIKSTAPAKVKGGGKQAILKPSDKGSWIYTVNWKDATGATKATAVNVTVS